MFSKRTSDIITVMDRKRRPKTDIKWVIAFSAPIIATIILIIINVINKNSVDDTEIAMPVIHNIDESLPLEEKEEKIYQSLLDAGYSPAGACGMMGNIAVESPDYDPSVVNESSGAYGLFQWTETGGRQTNLKTFCKKNSLDADSIDGQLAFAIYELRGADPIACRLNDFLMETDDSYAAAAEFAAGFERCISDVSRSADLYAGSIYPEFYGEYYQKLSKRINKAMNYYIRFTEADTTP